MSNNNAFAEVIESSLHGFLAQSWEWNNFPPFGSILSVKTPTRTLFAVVNQATTGSMDPVRHPFAYKKTHEELLKEQPQIFEFLKTTFTGLFLGYKHKDSLRYVLPPEPPAIHSFVHPLTTAEEKVFFSNEQYLYPLFGQANQIANLDELLLAIVRRLHELSLLSPERLQKFTHAYSLLTGNDYRRLKLFLSRAERLI